MNGGFRPSGSSLRLGLIGNPENRRITDFQKAVEALGYPVPVCLSYQELLRDPESISRFDVDLLRIDSPGENEAVARELIARGGGPPNSNLEFGEIGFLNEYHRGFCAVLELIERRGIPCLNSPGDIAVMFDKWASHQRFVDADVARPASTLAPGEFPAFLEQMRAQKNGRLFLKPLHGSSASGVCALRWTPGRQQLMAPLRIRSGRGQAILVNSLDVRTYTTLADIELILGLLLPQGMINEQWIPKISLPGGAVDLRVLVIAGEARHWVVRQSRHPMTNLHLGNQRGSGTALRELIGAAKLEAAFRLAEKAAACFPESLYAGVDILIDSRHRALVGEINAFGDLLPGLTHRGESAYTAIAKSAYAVPDLISPVASPGKQVRG
jgi:glutathione synthase/RimK-type ligase-like ATP-grasp enzyme